MWTCIHEKQISEAFDSCQLMLDKVPATYQMNIELFFGSQPNRPRRRLHTGAQMVPKPPVSTLPFRSLTSGYSAGPPGLELPSVIDLLGALPYIASRSTLGIVGRGSKAGVVKCKGFGCQHRKSSRHLVDGIGWDAASFVVLARVRCTVFDLRGQTYNAYNSVKATIMEFSRRRM